MGKLMCLALCKETDTALWKPEGEPSRFHSTDGITYFLYHPRNNKTSNNK